MYYIFKHDLTFNSFFIKIKENEGFKHADSITKVMPKVARSRTLEDDGGDSSLKFFFSLIIRRDESLQESD